MLARRFTLHGKLCLAEKPIHHHYCFEVKKEVVDRFNVGVSKLDLAREFGLSSDQLVTAWAQAWRATRYCSSRYCAAPTHKRATFSATTAPTMSSACSQTSKSCPRLLLSTKAMKTTAPSRTSTGTNRTPQAHPTRTRFDTNEVKTPLISSDQSERSPPGNLKTA